MNDLELEIIKVLKHHLRHLLDSKNNVFNYNDLEDLKDDLMYSISLSNSSKSK